MSDNADSEYIVLVYVGMGHGAAIFPCATTLTTWRELHSI